MKCFFSFLAPLCIAVVASSQASYDPKNMTRPDRYVLYTVDDRQCGWHKGNRIAINLVHEGQSAGWTYEVFSGKDLRITSTENGKWSSEVILVDGRWMVYKGESLPKFDAIDALDAPVVMLKVVLGALCKGAPSGPEELKEKKEVNMLEVKESILAKAGWANGAIEPPWALRGSIQPESSGYSFDLHLEPRKQQPLITLDERGSWAKVANLSFPDDMPLKGWKVFTLGLFKRPDGHGGMIVDYAAAPSSVPVKTLGELRTVPLKPQEK
ncbi:MAG TPA: hypothetical protein VJA94_21255 [Candidatus Angelobacter sp.]